MSGESGSAKKDLLELDDPVQASDLDLGAASGPAPRPTVIPIVDSLQYAEEFEFRTQMPTVTDESALEQARLQSIPTTAPPPRSNISAVPGPRDSLIEIDINVDEDEDQVETIGRGDQVAALLARLMPLTRVPSLAKPLSQIGAALEDPKTAYVIGFVDGILPLETIVDVTGLPGLDTLRVLDRLVSDGLLVFRAGRG